MPPRPRLTRRSFFLVAPFFLLFFQPPVLFYSCGKLNAEPLSIDSIGRLLFPPHSVTEILSLIGSLRRGSTSGRARLFFQSISLSVFPFWFFPLV